MKGDDDRPRFEYLALRALLYVVLAVAALIVVSGLGGISPDRPMTPGVAAGLVVFAVCLAGLACSARRD